MSNLQVNSTYTFNTRAPAILGAVIKNAKLIMSGDFETAMMRENVAVKYEQIYPALPPGSPSSPLGVIFHLFLTESGQRILIADPWIDSSTIVGITHLNAVVNLVNVTTQDLANVKTALSHLGVSFDIQIV